MKCIYLLRSFFLLWKWISKSSLVWCLILQPDVHAGQCWAFKGESGYLVIQLAVPIRPTAFSLEHIPKSLSTTGKIDSAPRDFEVYVSQTLCVFIFSSFAHVCMYTYTCTVILSDQLIRHSQNKTSCHCHFN